MKNFVVGFAFSPDGKEIALLLKDHPENLAGKLNGLGGGVEDGESYEEAMAREFREESGGAEIPLKGWRQFGVLRKPKFSVAFFRADAPTRFEFDQTRSEPANWYPLDSLMQRTNLAPNLMTMIVAAMDTKGGYVQITAD